MCSRFDALEFLSFLKTILPHLDVSDLPDGVGGLVAPGIETLIWTGQAPIQARFGLIPSWHTGPVKDFKPSTFNARIETASGKPAFKTAWESGRAVVGAEAFYEWDGPTSNRRKWRISRADNHPLVFAALWEQANCSGVTVNSFALLTRPAGPDMATIHTREPVLLEVEEVANWLSGNETFPPSPALRLTPQFQAEPQQASLF